MRNAFQFDPVAVNGVGSWYNPLSWAVVTGYDADQLQAESARLDAKLAAAQAEAERRYPINSPEYDAAVAAHMAAQTANTQNIPADINAAFGQGLSEGYNAELGVLQAAVRAPFNLARDVGSSILGGIPFWVWLLGAGAAFLYLGGGRYIERHAREALSK